LQINLRRLEEPNAPWSCTVKLITGYQYDPTAHESETPDYRFWRKMPEEKRDIFAQVTNPDDLEAILQRAQLAILNPGDPWQTYSSIDVDSMLGTNASLQTAPYQVEFSPNIISLDIEAPGLYNLSFIDLPGVINQTANDQDQYLTKLVKHLVKKYIDTDNALVVLAAPMDVDLNNSTAASTIKKIKNCKDRCVGKSPLSHPLNMEN
jgi:hypothetical protein